MRHALTGALASLRWAFMPLGLFALVAVGIHAAADLVDDRLLRVVEALDAALDGVLAGSELTSVWVERVGSVERTVLSRALALLWELAVDLLVALPLLGYSEQEPSQLSVGRQTWRSLFARLFAAPAPMRLARPLVVAAFALGGAYAVSGLTESSLFVGLAGDVASAQVAAVVARLLGALAMAVVLASLGWRAVLRALQHADGACLAVERTGRRAWAPGLWGSVLAVPLAVALLLEARALLSFVL